MALRSLLLLVVLMFSALASAQSLPPAEDYNWKSVFVAGDHSINNFDQGRVDLADLFDSYGAYAYDQRHFTSTDRYLRDNVLLATIENIDSVFRSMNVGQDDACLVHMTSHGAKGRGFYLSRSRILSPAKFASMVNKACGDQPSVILISACFSGQFITEDLAGPNRIILTAAIHDRPSFGCSPDYKYTFWDGCLLEEIPNSDTWQEAYDNIKKCIQRKEAQLGARPSLPQGYFGKNMRGFRILKK